MRRSSRFYNFDAGAGANARGSGSDHLIEIVERSNTARGFDTHLGTDRSAHQLDVMNGGARWAESSRCFHKIGAGRFCEQASGDLLIVIEQCGFKNYLDDRDMAVRGFHNGFDVALHRARIATAERSNVLHHVDLLGAIGDRSFGLGDFGRGGRCAKWKPDHGANFHWRCGKLGGGERHPISIHANAREFVVARLAAEIENIGAGGVGFEQRVIDDASDTRRRVRHKCNKISGFPADDQNIHDNTASRARLSEVRYGLMDGMLIAHDRVVQMFKAAIIVAIIFLIVVPNIPFTPGAGLDPSWIFGINLGHFERMVFGRDIIFTYGPLGYLMMPTFPEAEPWAVFAFVWGIALVAAYALWTLSKRARHWSEIVLYLGVFWIYSGLAWDSPIERPLGAVIALTLAVGIRLDDRPWFDMGLLSFLAALLLLAKFNIGIIATLAAFYFEACVVWQGRSTPSLVLKPAGAVVAVWLVTLVGFYWAVDGTLDGLGAFLRNSLEIANGYSEAMGLPGPLWVAVCAVASCVSLWFLVPLAAGKLRRVAWGVPLLIVMGFLCFKSAMVRQDAHSLPFPYQMAALSLLVVALASTWRSRIAVAMFVAGSLASGFAQLGERGLRPEQMDRLTGRAALASVDEYLHWPAAVATIETNTRLALAPDQIPPEFQPYVEGKRVTVYPWEIAMIRANHLPWQPLPVIQAYSAYTPRLDLVNARALEDPAGPEAILLSWDSIDAREPFYETPRSWWALLNWYDVKARSHNWPQNLCVVTRRSSPRFTPPLPIGTAVVHWGQTITLPAVGNDEALMMKAEIGESLKGVVKRELFRVPIVMVRATLQSGFIESQHVIRANLPNGVLVSDWPKSLGDLTPMFGPEGVSRDRVVSISFHTQSPDEFGRAIRIRWSRVKLRRP